MGLKCGDSARLQCEFSKTFFKLSTSAGLLRRRRGRGAGPQRSSGVLRSARGEPGGFPAPPPMPGTREAGTSLSRGRQEPPTRSQSPGRPAAFSLPALSCRGRSPSTSRPHTDPLGGQPAKRSGTGITRGAGRWVRDPPDFFLSPTSLLPFSFFPVALCVSLQVSLYCTLCLQSPTRSRHSASPGTSPRGPQGEGGGERGRAGRWLEVALRAAWRRWGLGKSCRGTLQTK